MNEKPSPHRNCQDFLRRLGIALGFDVEMPDIGWYSYSLERVFKGKRPDVLWIFKNAGVPFEGRKNLKLNEPYAIFEVESVTDWADIKRHLANIKETGLVPHVVFAVFYDGTIKNAEKEDLVEYARGLGFRLDILYKQELMNIFGEIINTKTQQEINDIKELYTLCEKIKRLTHSHIFKNAEKNSNFSIRSSDIFDGDCESFRRLQFGSCTKIGATVYRFELNAYTSELISSLRMIYKHTHITFSRIPFFVSINEILESDVWGKMRDKGVENYMMNIIESTLHYVDKVPTGGISLSVMDTYPAILNMGDIKYAIEISSKLDIWCKLFKSFLKLGQE